MTIRAPFVGRQLELTQLKQWCHSACAGRGAIALVGGELGIGKTRLAEELAAWAEGEGALVARGRWHESRELPADIGIRKALQELVADERVLARLDRTDPYVRELVRLGPEFAEALGLKEQQAPRREAEPYRLWRATLALLRAACAVLPVLLLLDDLQWADIGTLGLLGFLGTNIGTLPLLIVGTYRQEDVPADHPLHGLIADVLRAETLRHVRLQAMSTEEVAQLAAGITGTPVSGEFADVLQRQTRGNPLFVGEVVRHLMANEAARDAMDTPALLAELEVPEELRDVLARRLSTLSDRCRRLLNQASILGREFDVSVMERLSPHDRASLLATLDEALQAAAVQEVAPGRFSFAHPLVRSVVYAGLPASERLATHLQAAEALKAEFGPNAGLQAREIARHLLAAGSLAPPDDVVTYCFRGALQARESFALDEARSLLTGALAACDRLREPSRSLRAQLLLELGYAEAGLGHPDRAIEVYRQALTAYEALGDAEHALDARRWLASMLARYGRWTDVLNVTRDVLPAAKEDRSYAYVGLVGSHAMGLMLTGQMGEAEVWIEKLLKLAFDSETRAVAAHAAGGWHSWALGDHGDADRYFLDARRRFQEAGLGATASQAALDHAVISYSLGRPRQWAEADREAERLATETLRVSVLADVHAVRSLMGVHRGDWQQAAEQRARYQEIAAELGGATIYRQLLERGEALEQRWRFGPDGTAGLLKATAPLRSEPLIAALAAERGDRETAWLMLEPVLRVVPPRGRGLLWLSLALPLVSTLCTLGSEQADAWAASLSRYSGALFTWHVVDIELGRLHTLAKRWDDAEASFVRAIRVCQQLGLRPFLGLAYYHRALMLLTRGTRQDRRDAQASLGAAEAVFAELGLDYLREQVSALRVLPTRGRPHRNGPSGLTPREAAVLRLLAEGKSNREIASSLFVSERTVARHLENLYRKLGVASRGAAIAWAVKQRDAGAGGAERN